MTDRKLSWNQVSSALEKALALDPVARKSFLIEALGPDSARVLEDADAIDAVDPARENGSPGSSGSGLPE